MGVPRGKIPAEPIRRVVKAWLEGQKSSLTFSDPHGIRDKKAQESFYANDGTFSPRMQFVFNVWDVDDPEQKDGKYKILTRLLDVREGHRKRNYKGRVIKEQIRQEFMEFDLADKILCSLGLVHLWLDDPELREIYLNVDLAGLDARKPIVCEEVAA